MWKKFLAAMAIVGLMSTYTASAVVVDGPAPSDLPVDSVVASFNVEATSFNPSAGETNAVSFTLTETVEDVYAYAVDSSLDIVAVFADHVASSGASFVWYGTQNNQSDAAALADGTYTVKVFAFDSVGTIVGDAYTSVQIVSDGRGIIKNFTLDPSGSWDPTDEELSIEFELAEQVDNLTIDAKKGSKLIEIYDDIDVDDDDYTEFWDGTDEDGDYVDGGAWEIIIHADGDTVSRTINVDYQDPVITDALVTKTSFDPEQDEFTTLLYRVEAEAVVTVEVYKGSHKEFTLVDEELVDDEVWMTVNWDGTDEDGDTVKDGTDWKFKILSENPVDDDIFDIAFVEVDLADDEVNSKKTNVTQDYVSPAAYDRDKGGKLTAHFCIEDAADVYVAIYDGTSTSGSAELEVLDFVAQSSGCHTVQFDAVDKDGKRLKEGTYSYKIVSRTGSNQKDNEVGRFVIGDTSKGNSTPEDPQPPVTSGDCGNYPDTYSLGSSSETCAAIEWVTNAGIFRGYADGSFGPYNDITRAEVLKVVLLAFDTTILPIDGTNLGFPDVNADAWYMPFVRTAKLYGMIHGYTDGEAKLDRSVSRAELLKFALEASESFTSYVAPTYNNSFYSDVTVGDWYKNYAGVAYSYMLFDEYYDNASGRYSLRPNQSVKRGEAALLLYRMYQGGLL